MMNQEKFDLMIGRLDRILSEMVGTSKLANCEDACIMDAENMQTLKHHAEDMIGAGQKILDCLAPPTQGKVFTPLELQQTLKYRIETLRTLLGRTVVIQELKDMPINNSDYVCVPLTEYDLCVVRFRGDK